MALMHLARRWLDLIQNPADSFAPSSRGAERAVAIQGVICDPGLLRSAGNDKRLSAGFSITHRSAADFTVVTVDHGLRAESREEAAFVAGAAQALGFTHTTLSWEGDKPKTGIQAAARRARYDLLASACQAGAKACIVTAHTEDDQAETVLMRLRRGSGVDGLAGMDAVSEWDGVAVVRPLLCFSKARLLAYLRASAIPFVRDPSNDNTAFERVRLRHAMKALAAAGIGRASLARAASRVGRSRKALDAIADGFLDRHFEVTPLAQGAIGLEAFDALPEDIALRVLARVLALAGGGQAAPRLMRVESLLASLRAGASDATLGGCIVIAASGTLKFYREPGRLRAAPLPFEPGASRTWDGRFILTFGTCEAGGTDVRQLGAEGWRTYKKVIRDRRLVPYGDRLAALTTPALWKDNFLICAPALGFFNANDDRFPAQPVEAALSPSLARYSTGVPAGAASVLGKDTPLPYL